MTTIESRFEKHLIYNNLLRKSIINPSIQVKAPSFEAISYSMKYSQLHTFIVKVSLNDPKDWVYVIDLDGKLLSKLRTFTSTFIVSSINYTVQMLQTNGQLLKQLEEQCCQDLENIAHAECLLASKLQDFHLTASDGTNPSGEVNSSPPPLPTPSKLDSTQHSFAPWSTARSLGGGEEDSYVSGDVASVTPSIGGQSFNDALMAVTRHSSRNYYLIL